MKKSKRSLLAALSLSFLFFCGSSVIVYAEEDTTEETVDADVQTKPNDDAAYEENENIQVSDDFACEKENSGKTSELSNCDNTLAPAETGEKTDSSISENLTSEDSSGFIEKQDLSDNILPNEEDEKTEWIGCPLFDANGWPLNSPNNSQIWYLENGEKVSGWKEIDSNWYYFNPDFDCQLSLRQFIGNPNDVEGWQAYYVNEYGQRIVGWSQIDLGAVTGLYSDPDENKYIYGNNWVYGDSNGVLYWGWKEIDEKKYYLTSINNKTGLIYPVMYTGLLVQDKEGNTEDAESFLTSGSCLLDAGQVFYLSPDGSMKSGWQNITLDSQNNNCWYYFDLDGNIHTGWLQDGNIWYYLSPETGKMQTNWQLIKNKWYFFNKSGAMATGWLYDNGWYYLRPAGDMVVNWQNIQNNWYYFNNSGMMRTGWLYDNGWYYLRSDGDMAVNWQNIQNNWYYFNNSGLMQTGWLEDGAWYYLEPSGEMKTDWHLENGNWYYLQPDGSMATGWQIIKEKLYYLQESGAAILNAEKIIDGTAYTFDADGAAQKTFDLKIRSYMDSVYNKVGKSLWNAYCYVVNNFSYQTLAIPYPAKAGYSTVETYALKGFSDKKGNCYCFAAAFYYLAKDLGYDASWIDGYVYLNVSKTWADHGYVIIKENGATYYYDPVMQNSYGYGYTFYRQPAGSTTLSYKFK